MSVVYSSSSLCDWWINSSLVQRRVKFWIEKYTGQRESELKTFLVLRIFIGTCFITFILSLSLTILLLFYNILIYLVLSYQFFIIFWPYFVTVYCILLGNILSSYWTLFYNCLKENVFHAKTESLAGQDLVN